MLTPFELAQVKAEDLDGAAQTLQRPRDIVSAVRPHAALEHLEIGEKRPCIGVRALAVGDRERQAPMDERDLAAIRLRLLARSDRIAHVRQRGAVRVDRREEFGRNRTAHGILREPHLEILDRALVAFEHEAPRLLVGGDDRVGRDVGVAVAVPAYPAAEMQHRRHVPAQTVLQAFEQQRCLVEQRLAETGDEVAHLVVHGRRAAVQLVALPQQQDLRAQLRLDALAVLRGEHPLVEVAQGARDRGDLVAGRAAQHLGRVRGEDQREFHLVDGSRRLRRERLERAAQRRLAVQRAFAPAPLAMQLFRQVDHLKVQAERADHFDRILARELVEQAVDLRVDRGARRSAAFARQPAQPLDVFEGGRARVRPQCIADQPPQQCDLRTKRRRALAALHQYERGIPRTCSAT